MSPRQAQVITEALNAFRAALLEQAIGDLFLRQANLPNNNARAEVNKIIMLRQAVVSAAATVNGEEFTGLCIAAGFLNNARGA
jgi:hypothetical protein